MLRMGGQPVDAPVTRSWTAKGTLRQAAPHSIDRVAAMCTFSSATLGLTMAAASPSRGLARSRAFHVKLQLVSILQRPRQTIIERAQMYATAETRNGRVYEAFLQTSAAYGRAECSGQRLVAYASATRAGAACALDRTLRS